MVSEGTLALLSACHFLLKGRDLAIARDQIRMILGCLKALGELWPRTARNVQEIQTIAHQVLGIGSELANNNDTSNSSEVPCLFGGEGSLGSLNSIEDLCGWYNIGNLNDLSWA
jgi:hypothetical protein